VAVQCSFPFRMLQFFPLREQAAERNRSLIVSGGATLRVHGYAQHPFLHLLAVVVWLGFKPLLIGLVLALRIPCIPVVMRLQCAVDGLTTRVPATDDVRRLLALGVCYEMAMRVAAVLALLLAMYKPG
jgi:hypothetical protein